MSQGDKSSNILVAIRMRPLNAREKSSVEGSKICCELFPKDATVRISDPEFIGKAEAEKNTKTFSFDYLYDSSKQRSEEGYADQEMVYRDIGLPLVEGVLKKGVNGCLFAYGLTGTGKTYSMMGYGDQSQRGIVPRCLDSVFGDIEDPSRAGMAAPGTKCTISYLEFYNDKLRDLLDPSAEGAQPLEVRSNPTAGVYITNLTEVVVSDRKKAEELLQFGNKMKSVASTNMNATSSRSHTCFVIKVEVDGRVNKLNLVDLAGRENEKNTAATGERFKELTFINKSLFELAGCIHALASGAKSIPFRNNKLTFALSDSLSGMSKTSLLAAVTPAASSWADTTATLRFAAATKTIKTKKVLSANASKEDIIRALRAEVSGLKLELSRFRALPGDEAAETGAGEDGGSVAAVLPVDSLSVDEKDEVAQQIQEQIDTANGIIENYNKDWTVEESKASQIIRQQGELLKSLGLLSDTEEAKELSKETPFLMNLSDDAFLTGKMLFFLTQGKTVFVGNDKTNDSIYLTGLGVGPSMARIACDINGAVTIQFSGSAVVEAPGASAESSSLVELTRASRVLVNGRRLALNAQVRLHHNDRIIVGHAIALRVVVPADAKAGDLHQSALLSSGDYKMSVNFGAKGSSPRAGAALRDALLPSTLEGAIEEIEDEESESFVALRPFVEKMREEYGNASTGAFLKKLHKAAYSVDEANHLTVAMRPSESIAFKLGVMEKPFQSEASIRLGGQAAVDAAVPELVVRLVQTPSLRKWRAVKAAQRAEEAEVLPGASAEVLSWLALDRMNESHVEKEMELLVWRWEKFEERLCQMRDLYDEFNRGHKEHAGSMSMRSLRFAKAGAADAGMEFQLALPQKVADFLKENPFKDAWREFGASSVDQLVQQAEALKVKLVDAEAALQEARKESAELRRKVTSVKKEEMLKRIHDLEGDINSLDLLATTLVEAISPRAAAAKPAANNNINNKTQSPVLSKKLPSSNAF